MAAPAAPVVIEGGALAAVTGALILAVLAWATLFGLQQFYTYTLGALLHALTVALNAIPLIDLGSRTVGKADKFVQEQIGRALSGAETSVSRTWYALGWLARQTADTVEFLAQSTLQAFENLTRSDIPTIVKTTVTIPARKLAGEVAALRRQIADTRQILRAQVAAIDRDLDRTFGLARSGIDSLRGVTIPALQKEIAAAAAGTIALGRYVNGTLDRRIGRLEKLAVGTALTAAVIAAVSRLAPWIRCSNVGKMGRAVCRSDTRWLDSLIAGGLILAGSLSLRQMARELREPTGFVMDGLEGLVRELKQGR
jgi:hypothetical protein